MWYRTIPQARDEQAKRACGTSARQITIKLRLQKRLVWITNALVQLGTQNAAFVGDTIALSYDYATRTVSAIVA